MLIKNNIIKIMQITIIQLNGIKIIIKKIMLITTNKTKLVIKITAICKLITIFIIKNRRFITKIEINVGSFTIKLRINNKITLRDI
jgi:hypothetical protein